MCLTSKIIKGVGLSVIGIGTMLMATGEIETAGLGASFIGLGLFVVEFGEETITFHERVSQSSLFDE